MQNLPLVIELFIKAFIVIYAVLIIFLLIELFKLIKSK